VKTASPRELNGENMPFVIGIKNQFQFQMMLEHGHESAVSLDATFGTNQPKVRLPTCLEFPSLLACSYYGFLTRSRTTGDSLAVSPRKSLAQVQGPVWSLMLSRMIVLQFLLYTLMVFDKWWNGVLIAFIITKRSKQINLSPWMMELKRKVVAASPEWRPNAFIVDDALTRRWKSTQLDKNSLYIPILLCEVLPRRC
jgi:hypothetical protein